jgi:hypothetical protein
MMRAATIVALMILPAWALLTPVIAILIDSWASKSPAGDRLRRAS